MPVLPNSKLVMLAESQTARGITDLKGINHSIQLRLRRAVDQLGWSDSEVAQKANLPQSTVYRVLNAKTANPSFAVVYLLCQTLGIALPFESTTTKLICPIDYFIGYSSMDLIRQEQKQECVHILPAFQNYQICKVIDDCADRKYPKGSLLFMEEFDEPKMPLDTGEVVIVQILKSQGAYNFIPMILLEGAPCELGNTQMILHHLTSNTHKQVILNTQCESSIGDIESQKHKIIGRIQKALI